MVEWICKLINDLGVRSEIMVKSVVVVLLRNYFCKCYFYQSRSFNHTCPSDLLDWHLKTKQMPILTKVGQWVKVRLLGTLQPTPSYPVQRENMWCLVTLIPRKQLLIVLRCRVIFTGMWRVFSSRPKPRNKRLTL